MFVLVLDFDLAVVVVDRRGDIRAADVEIAVVEIKRCDVGDLVADASGQVGGELVGVLAV